MLIINHIGSYPRYIMEDEDTVMESSPAVDVIVKATFRLLVPANVSNFTLQDC